MFAENGPFEISKGGEVTERKYGWDVESDLLYVDQPLNVGFSYSTVTLSPAPLPHLPTPPPFFPSGPHMSPRCPVKHIDARVRPRHEVLFTLTPSRPSGGHHPELI